MRWHFSSLLFFLAVFFSVGSQHVPIAVKNIAISPSIELGLVIWWPCYELDASYKIQFLNIDDGTTKTFGPVNASDVFIAEKCYRRYYPEPNMTHKLNIIPINEHGEGPPSPDIFFRNDPDQDAYLDFAYGDLHPRLPMGLHVKWNTENRVNVTWNEVTTRRTQDESLIAVTHPIEYTLHYADTKELSVWNTVKTNNTWIMLEDLKKGALYNAYVTATEKNRTSLNSFIIAVSIDEDMTGLPEPVIIIEPSYKNGASSWKSINCTLSPNIDMMNLRLELTVGSHVVRAKYGESWVHIETKEDINTASCTVSHLKGLDFCTHHPTKCSKPLTTQSTRTSTRKWETPRSWDTEYAKQKEEGMGDPV